MFSKGSPPARCGRGTMHAELEPQMDDFQWVRNTVFQPHCPQYKHVTYTGEHPPSQTALSMKTFLPNIDKLHVETWVSGPGHLIMYMQILQHLETILSTLWFQAFHAKGGPFAVTADSCALTCKSLIILIPSTTFSSSLVRRKL